MNEAEKDEHYIKLCLHLRTGGNVIHQGGPQVQLTIRNILFTVMAECPEQFTIIERPMVYVYRQNGMFQAISSDELAQWGSLDEYMGNRNVTEYKSIPIEDMK